MKLAESPFRENSNAERIPYRFAAATPAPHVVAIYIDGVCLHFYYSLVSLFVSQFTSDCMDTGYQALSLMHSLF